MKKSITIVSLFIVFLVIYFLQANFFNWFNIAGVKPNLFVLFILIVGLFTDRKLSIISALLFGFILDINNGKLIGISSIMFIIIAILAEIYNKNFSKDSRATFMLMGAGATALYEIGWYLLNVIELSMTIEIYAFIKILIVELIFNTLLTIILYPQIQKYGNILSENYKGQKVLTKYF